jgi:hypothetical protein
LLLPEAEPGNLGGGIAHAVLAVLLPVWRSTLTSTMVGSLPRLGAAAWAGAAAACAGSMTLPAADMSDVPCFKGMPVAYVAGFFQWLRQYLLHLGRRKNALMPAQSRGLMPQSTRPLS